MPRAHALMAQRSLRDVRRRSLRHAAAWGLTLAAASGCSQVRCQWRDPALRRASLQQAADVLPKHIAVVGWAPGAADTRPTSTRPPSHAADAPEPATDGARPAAGGAQASADAGAEALAEVLAQVATDLIKLHRNYLVLQTQAAQRHWAEACGAHVEGVLWVRALQAEAQARGGASLEVETQLLRCRDGALVWRAEGVAGNATCDASLRQLTDTYAAQLGEANRPYVAPAFALLQRLLGQLPDVALSDAEVDEKIELGLWLPTTPGPV